MTLTSKLLLGMMVGVLVLLLTLAVILTIRSVHAQVEIKQSTTVNGQTTKLQSGEDFTKVTTGKYLVSIHQVGDSLKFRICDMKIIQIADTCHNYVLYKNGTMTQEGS
jgi:hypothetical protein